MSNWNFDPNGSKWSHNALYTPDKAELTQFGIFKGVFAVVSGGRILSGTCVTCAVHIAAHHQTPDDTPYDHVCNIVHYQCVNVHIVSIVCCLGVVGCFMVFFGVLWCHVVLWDILVLVGVLCVIHLSGCTLHCTHNIGAPLYFGLPIIL